MATQTTTASATLPESNVKCVGLIKKIDKNASEGASLKVQLAQMALSEGARMNLDREGIRVMLVLSWREARDFNTDGKASEKDIRQFDSDNRFAVSKVMSLAYPASDKAQADLDAAIELNKKLSGMRGRIGEQRLLDISRGKLSFAEAKSGLSVKKIRTAKEKKAAKPSLHETIENDKIPVPQRFLNSFKVVCESFAKDLTVAQMREITVKYLDVLAKASK